MEKTWIIGRNGNRCSIERWGSVEAAGKALASLTYCTSCDDCSDCNDCHNCKDCHGCNGCVDCDKCTRCSDCTKCDYCTRCVDCDKCTRCVDHWNGLDLFESDQEVGVVPIIPNIHQTIYAAASQPEALNMSDWHTCEWKHCRAGWAVFLAGEVGKKLEEKLGTSLAAMKIYDASDPKYKIFPQRFFDSNEAALQDMKRLAEKELNGQI